jgi:cytochrome oxidase Cu insertion factor (SCO1/SenC/PrrC family)
MKTKYGFLLLLTWTTNICIAQQTDADFLEQVNDFTYTLASGKQETLYTLQSEMLLLYFYNPRCDDCHALMKELETSEIINQLIDDTLPSP